MDRMMHYCNLLLEEFSVPLTSLKARGTAHRDRDSLRAIPIRHLRSRGGSDRFMPLPVAVPLRLRRRCVRARRRSEACTSRKCSRTGGQPGGVDAMELMQSRGSLQELQRPDDRVADDVDQWQP